MGPKLNSVGSWARYLGLGTQAEADRQAIGGWARYLGSGAQAEADDDQS